MKLLKPVIWCLSETYKSQHVIGYVTQEFNNKLTKWSLQLTWQALMTTLPYDSSHVITCTIQEFYMNLNTWFQAYNSLHHTTVWWLSRCSYQDLALQHSSLSGRAGGEEAPHGARCTCAQQTLQVMSGAHQSCSKRKFQRKWIPFIVYQWYTHITPTFTSLSL